MPGVPAEAGKEPEESPSLAGSGFPKGQCCSAVQRDSLNQQLWKSGGQSEHPPLASLLGCQPVWLGRGEVVQLAHKAKFSARRSLIVIRAP